MACIFVDPGDPGDPGDPAVRLLHMPPTALTYLRRSCTGICNECTGVLMLYIPKVPVGFGRGVQFRADYCNSMHPSQGQRNTLVRQNIVEAEYSGGVLHADAVKQLIIRAKLRRFSEFRTEIGF